MSENLYAAPQMPQANLSAPPIAPMVYAPYPPAQLVVRGTLGSTDVVIFVLIALFAVFLAQFAGDGSKEADTQQNA